MTHLTPFDTGARAEPTVWAPVPPGAAYGDIIEGKHDDRYGRVDFENDSSEHVVTVRVERDADGEYVLVASQPIRVRIESENIGVPSVTLEAQEVGSWHPWRVLTTCTHPVTFCVAAVPSPRKRGVIVADSVDEQLPIEVVDRRALSRLEHECAAAATRWDAVAGGNAENPRGLSRGEFIADHLSHHFTFTPHREEQDG